MPFLIAVIAIIVLVVCALLLLCDTQGGKRWICSRIL